MAGPQQNGFDVNAARQAGYSDDEILSHLTQTRKFDVDGALSSGYSKADVINYLSGTPAQDTSLWGKVKSAFASRSALDMPGAKTFQQGSHELPGSTEGSGLMRGLSDWEKASGGEIAGGVGDIAQGNIARGGHRVIQGAGAATVPALPFLAPVLASNPGLALRVAAGGAGGSFLGQKGAEAFGATPDQAAFAGDVGGLVGGYGAAKLPSLTSRLSGDALRSTAGGAFNKVSAAAGSDAVDTNAAGQVVLDAQKMQNAGRTMPRTMQRFLQRVTAPNAPDLTYDEAREFYSAAGELSANEKAAITPKMRRALNNFKSELGGAIQQTADNAGVGTEYGQAMSDYAKAKRLEDTWDTVWAATKKNLVPALIKGAGYSAGAGAIYGAYRTFSK